MGRAYQVRKESMAKTTVKKAKLYSKYSKEIYMAAKQGGTNPETNLNLKRIIEDARSKEVTNEVIERAIDKAEGGSEDHYHESSYEGFGPGASTVIVECLTDNDHRSHSQVRNAFKKSYCKMGVSGSVVHNYEHVGILSFEYHDEERVFETLLEEDIEIMDIDFEEGFISTTVKPSHLHKAKDALENDLGKIKFDILEISYIPFEYIRLNESEEENFNRLMDMLDDVEDVQNVYHNVQGANK